MIIQHDSIIRKATLYYELRPSEKGNVLGDNWPTETDVPKEHQLTYDWMDEYPLHKKRCFFFCSRVLQLHEGDWHEGGQIYRRWFDKHYNVKRQPTWLRMKWHGKAL